MSTYLDLNPELTPTQAALKEETHRFAKEVMRPASIALDKLADPEDVIRDGSVYWDVTWHRFPRSWAAPTCAASKATSSARRWAGAQPTSP
jgi:hypothetical protein